MASGVKRSLRVLRRTDAESCADDAVSALCSVAKRKRAPTDGFAGLWEALRRSATPTMPFEEKVLPFIERQAALWDAQFPDGLPVLVAPGVLVLSRQQVSVVLSSMFLGVLPEQHCDGAADSYLTFNDCNFQGLFNATHAKGHAILRLILQYFWRLAEAGAPPTGDIVIRRLAAASTEHHAGDPASALLQHLAPGSTVAVPEWSTCRAALQPIEVRGPNERIDGAGPGALQADFANAYIGGGVLHGSAVQEEILFACMPEHLVALAVAPAMLPHEALLITGAEAFATSSGYNNSLRFGGNCDDPTPRLRSLLLADGGSAARVEGIAASAAAMPSLLLTDAGIAAAAPPAAPRGDGGGGDGRVTLACASGASIRLHPDTRLRHTIALDAHRFGFSAAAAASRPERALREQLADDMLRRELRKACVAFAADAPEASVARVPAVATGNWGCGAFNGHLGVKALVQWAACSAGGRRMVYCPFDQHAAVALQLHALSAALAGGEGGGCGALSGVSGASDGGGGGGAAAAVASAAAPAFDTGSGAARSAVEVRHLYGAVAAFARAFEAAARARSGDAASPPGAGLPTAAGASAAGPTFHAAELDASGAGMLAAVARVARALAGRSD